MMITLKITAFPWGKVSPQKTAYTFDRAGGVMGRAGHCQWVLPDPEKTVSGEHAKIQYQIQGFTLTDLSTNGVYWKSGDRLAPGVPTGLDVGQVFQIGPYEILVESIEQESRVPDMPSAFQTVGDHSHWNAPLDTLKAQSPQGFLGVGGVSVLSALCQYFQLDARLFADIPESVLNARIFGILERLLIGLLGVMAGRAELKRILHLDPTPIRATHNNPFQFSSTPQLLLERLLREQDAAFLPAPEAIANSYQVLLRYQEGLLKAFKEAASGVQAGEGGAGCV